MPKPKIMDDWLDEILVDFGNTCAELKEQLETDNGRRKLTPEIFMARRKYYEKQAKALITAKMQEVDKRANYLNDALGRAAKYMLDNNCIPDDSTSVGGIKSYFLNDARFKEASLKGGDV